MSNGTTDKVDLQVLLYQAEESFRRYFDAAQDLIDELEEENDILTEQNDDLSQELAKLQQEIHDLRQPGNVLLRQ